MRTTQIARRAPRQARLHTALLLVAALLLTASCRSSKSAAGAVDAQAEASAAHTAFSTSNYFNTISRNALEEDFLTAKIRIQILMDGKSVSSTGTLRMQRDEVIQLSVVDPLLGIAELGRMEFSTDRVLLIDRFHKQYIDVPYAEIDFLQRANVDFYALQSLFWNEVFQPGTRRASASAFSYTNSAGQPVGTQDGIVNLNYKDRVLQYEFQTVQPSGTLSRTIISGESKSKAEFQFDYADFQKFGGKDFPFEMVMAFIMGSRQAQFKINLSGVRSNSDWVKHTPAPKKYTKANPTDILRSLVR